MTGSTGTGKSLPVPPGLGEGACWVGSAVPGTVAEVQPIERPINTGSTRQPEQHLSVGLG